MQLSKEQLYLDLLTAYYCARKGKTKKWYVKEFEKNLDENLRSLTDDIYNRQYIPSPFNVFVIKDPKIREIFAAVFRDRVVHHLYYNYVHEYFERTFIVDCYSCIKGRGTSYGIDRLRHHIESCSLNYTKPCYILKLDIKSYFVNINRKILLKEVLSKLDRFNKKFPSRLDLELLIYLSKEIILFDPTLNAIPVGNCSLWGLVPEHKSLYNAPEDCGLPLGNLTSQLFSNIYLNILDQFIIKRILHIKHYGRYVDDFFLVCNSKYVLRKLIPIIENFLKLNLQLQINHGKIIIRNALFGIEFLGAFLKQGRTYISNQTLRRLGKNKQNNNKDSILSYFSVTGLLSRYNSFSIKKDYFIERNLQS